VHAIILLFFISSSSFFLFFLFFLFLHFFLFFFISSFFFIFFYFFFFFIFFLQAPRGWVVGETMSRTVNNSVLDETTGPELYNIITRFHGQDAGEKIRSFLKEKHIASANWVNKDDGGKNCLMLALELGNINAFHELVKHSPGIDHINNAGQSVFHLAARYPNIAFLNDLFSNTIQDNKRMVYLPDKQDEIPLEYAIGARNIENIRIFRKNQENFPPIPTGENQHQHQHQQSTNQPINNKTRLSHHSVHHS
jgi:hypothetical protein